ncbi:hypothetical protein GCM10020256_50250 [Streptomyces thermocoprophilus]
MASQNRTSPAGRPTTALVLGGGLAGLLAAYELAPYVDSVTVVDRGHRHGPGAGPAPDEPALMLHAAGARALEELHPGILDELVAAGAHRLGMTTDMAILTLRGWLAHGCDAGFVLTCTRGLARRVVRERALRPGNITVLENTEAVSLTGDSYVLTGAVVRDRASGRMRRLDAGIVVDATGRGKGVTRRISELGLPPVPVDSLDGGIAYATRTFRLAPHIAAGRPPCTSSPTRPTTAGAAPCCPWRATAGWPPSSACAAPNHPSTRRGSWRTRPGCATPPSSNSSPAPNPSARSRAGSTW